MSEPLVDELLRRAPAEATAGRDRAELGAVIATWIAEARAAWPGIALDEAAFVGHVGERAAIGLDAICATDLWLAAACLRGDAAACQALDALLQRLRPAFGQFGLVDDEIDEVLQRLRAMLLVGDGPGDEPRLAAYAGRAELKMWVRTIAMRAAVDLRRRRRDAPAGDDELAALPAVTDDPELVHLRERYRDQLAAAVAEAITQLEPRERLLLKYHFLDGLTVDRLGAHYGVHRATAARWVSAAREALATRAQQLLVARLGLTPSEVRSIARLVESQLDLSMRRLLA